MFRFIYSVNHQASPCWKRKVLILLFQELMFFSPCVCPLQVTCREVMAVLPHPVCSDACNGMQLNEKK